MIDYYKDILGIATTNTDYDIYLVVITAVTLSWIVKSVITGIYQTVLHIFR